MHACVSTICRFKVGPRNWAKEIGHSSNNILHFIFFLGSLSVERYFYRPLVVVWICLIILTNFQSNLWGFPRHYGIVYFSSLFENGFSLLDLRISTNPHLIHQSSSQVHRCLSRESWRLFFAAKEIRQMVWSLIFISWQQEFQVGVAWGFNPGCNI